MENIFAKKATMKKVGELLTEHNHVVFEQASKLFDSGAIDTTKYKGYVLAKILITASLNGCNNIFAPIDKNLKKEIKNLENF